MEELNNAENAVGTPIQEFYRDKTIFITGATGFLGKVLVEKLLYSCPQVNSLYLLVRSKKNKDCQQRLQEFLEDEAFSRLDQKAHLKVCAIPGDVSQAGLGLSEEHRKLLVEKIDIVFHVAATVRFDEPLPVAVAINVAGTRELIDIAREMKNLKAYVHVSTAFSNCIKKEIEEKIYDPPMQHEKLIQLTKCLDNNQFVENITPIILDKWPNTYVFTKSVAEEIIKTQCKGIPISIFRPSIVVASYQEPIAGWIDNLYGATGVVVGCGTGVLRTINCDTNKVADIVPADMTVNAMIATAWKTANRAIDDTNHNEPNPSTEDSVAVYNYVSSVENPIQWGEFMALAKSHGQEVPTTQAIWCLCLTLHKSWLLHKISVLFLHFLPAIIMDVFASLIGKQANMVRLYKRVSKFTNVVAYFAVRNWTFRSDNVQDLWQSLNTQDKKIFPFDISSLDWNGYFYNYVRGVRKFILKDDPSTVPYAKIKLRRFVILHKGLKLLVAFLVLRLLWAIISPAFS